MSKLVLDASVVICWCEELEDSIILDELVEAGFDLLLPQRVGEEVKSENCISDKVRDEATRYECDSERYETYSDRFFRLGSGEKAVIGIGKSLHESDEDYFCVLDDQHARFACEKLDLQYLGTIGLLGKLIENDRITLDRGKSLIREMKTNGTHLPNRSESLLEEILD